VKEGRRFIIIQKKMNYGKTIWNREAITSIIKNKVIKKIGGTNNGRS